MRILFISEYFPFQPRTDVSGVFQRMRMLLEALGGLGELDLLLLAHLGIDTSPAGIRRLEAGIETSWNVRVNAFIRDQLPARARPLRERLPTWIRCIREGAVAFEYELSLNNSHEPSLHAVTRCLERKPDAILAFRLGAMAPLLRLSRSLPPVLFDLDDAEHVKAMRWVRRQTRFTRRVRALAAVPILWWSEYRAMALAHSTFVTSSRDLDRFRRFPRHAHRLVVPNAVALPSLARGVTEPILVYVGNYVYRPNVEAAEYLVRDIWPRVKAAMPTARLVVVGSEPERVASYASPPPGVVFSGFVDDLEAIYCRARAVCCPILVAGGTRVKLLEAAAYGKPIVATTIGAEGIELRDGREILLRDDAVSFAAACVKLLQDTALGDAIGTAARLTVGRRYERSGTVDQVRRSVTALLAAGRR